MWGEAISDPKLARLRDTAALALYHVEAYFEQELGPNWKKDGYQIFFEES